MKNYRPLFLECASIHTNYSGCPPFGKVRSGSVNVSPIAQVHNRTVYGKLYSGSNSIAVGRIRTVVAELCGLRTFGGIDLSLGFICGQSVSEFLWDRLRAIILFTFMPKRA